MLKLFHLGFRVSAVWYLFVWYLIYFHKKNEIKINYVYFKAEWLWHVFQFLFRFSKRIYEFFLFLFSGIPSWSRKEKAHCDNIGFTKCGGFHDMIFVWVLLSLWELLSKLDRFVLWNDRFVFLKKKKKYIWNENEIG